MNESDIKYFQANYIVVENKLNKATVPSFCNRNQFHSLKREDYITIHVGEDNFTSYKEVLKSRIEIDKIARVDEVDVVEAERIADANMAELILEEENEKAKTGKKMKKRTSQLGTDRKKIKDTIKTTPISSAIEIEKVATCQDTISGTFRKFKTIII